jgi:hypothetical protein
LSGKDFVMGHFEQTLLRLLHLLVHWVRDRGWIESPQPALVPLRSRLSPLASGTLRLGSGCTAKFIGPLREEEPLWDRSDGWSSLRSRYRN